MEVSAKISKNLRNHFNFEISIEKVNLEYIVEITLTHIYSEEKFYLKVDNQVIINTKKLFDIFDSPKDLYLAVKDKLNTLTVDDGGVINFKIFVSKLRV
jgi:hypothetical protein